MSLKRYDKLRSNLHFVDNRVMEKIPQSFQNSKIQPVIYIAREHCLKFRPEECYSFDEQTIPVKTKYSATRLYNPRNQ